MVWRERGGGEGGGGRVTVLSPFVETWELYAFGLCCVIMAKGEMDFFPGISSLRCWILRIINVGMGAQFCIIRFLEIFIDRERKKEDTGRKNYNT